MAKLSSTVIYGDLNVNGNVISDSMVGDLDGNSSTATTLKNPRTINGSTFDGSQNISTANWGTSRTITVGNTAKPVNGAGDVSWSLPEIGIVSSTQQPSVRKAGSVWIHVE